MLGAAAWTTNRFHRAVTLRFGSCHLLRISLESSAKTGICPKEVSLHGKRLERRPLRPGDVHAAAPAEGRGTNRRRCCRERMDAAQRAAHAGAGRTGEQLSF